MSLDLEQATASLGITWKVTKVTSESIDLVGFGFNSAVEGALDLIAAVFTILPAAASEFVTRHDVSLSSVGIYNVMSFFSLRG